MLKCNDSFFARKFERPMCLPLEKFLDNYLLKDEKCTCSKTGFWVSKSLTHYKFNKKLNVIDRLLNQTLAEDIKVDNEVIVKKGTIITKEILEQIKQLFAI